MPVGKQLAYQTSLHIKDCTHLLCRNGKSTKAAFQAQFQQSYHQQQKERQRQQQLLREQQEQYQLHLQEQQQERQEEHELEYCELQEQRRFQEQLEQQQQQLPIVEASPEKWTPFFKAQEDRDGSNRETDGHGSEDEGGGEHTHLPHTLCRSSDN